MGGLLGGGGGGKGYVAAPLSNYWRAYPPSLPTPIINILEDFKTPPHILLCILATPYFGSLNMYEFYKK